MPTGASHQRSEASQLAAANARLAATLRLMEAERTRLLRQRRVHLVLLGLAISLPVHILILIWLANVRIERPAGEEGAGVEVTLAALPETPEEAAEETPLADVAMDAIEAVTSADQAAPALDPSSAVSELRAGDAGSLSIGGSEGTGGTGLGGGVAGTSFFGVGAKGTRFAYIVDMSGSMETNQKWTLARQELERSVESLPDFAYFHVVLFSYGAVVPDWQSGWNRARRLETLRLHRWLSNIAPAGGTEPGPAFFEVFALDVLPDVLYFMTDGQIPSNTPMEVRRLNGRGKTVVINTIAFGDESGRDALRQIAEDSGGTYRFVSPGGF
ncbi:MAG: VWA domain-containing protein [Phycisphaerales bacterium]|nr:VWA domain-containing protein [Phycisphaerales bacterium]